MIAATGKKTFEINYSCNAYLSFSRGISFFLKPFYSFYKQIPLIY